MRNRLMVVVAVFMCLLLAAPGYCALNNWGQTDTNDLLKRVVPGYLQSAGTAIGSATSVVTSQAAIPVIYCYVQKAITSSVVHGENNGTLANGTKGQLLTIRIYQESGSASYVLTPTTKTGFSTLTFDEVEDTATLLYVDDTVGWILISNSSVTVGLP